MNWFLGRLRDADSEQQRTGRLVVIFALCSAVVGMVFSPICYGFSGPVPGVFIAIVSLFLGLTSCMVRWTGSPLIATQCYLLMLWLLLAGVALLIGGISSPGLPAYSVLILGATFLGGRRTGITWAVISLLTIIVIWQIRGQWFEMASIGEEDLQILLTMGYMAIVFLVSLFALQYDRVKTQALTEVRAANRRTTQMIAQLEQTSRRLSKSSERFLGSRHSTDLGLMGRMMQKARDGRTAIEQSRTSISGMIEQYRDIGRRVNILFEESTIIVDLVSTIDRISDRLDLMALNVGIEATHGGESGRQFMTLASDMRLLAERVLNETRQIKDALRKVRSQVQEVLESSKFGQELTEVSADKMASMAQTLDDIFKLIEEAEDATSQITVDTIVQIDAVRELVTVAGAVRTGNGQARFTPPPMRTVR
ncbi:MAG: methyl-accepting chemotaxis protein [Myxococcota bacterium]